MLPIALDIHRLDFRTDFNYAVTAWRAVAKAQFITKGGTWVSVSCLVDSGAPLSVIPYSRWQGLDLDWTHLGGQLVPQVPGVSAALEWQGVACDLGMARCNLLDHQAATIHGPFLVVGKFPRKAHPRPEPEKQTILGVNFLTDNLCSLALDGKTAGLAGGFSVP
jgi:hypothetical protein